MTGSDRWAALMLILAILAVTAVGTLEYLQSGKRKELAAIQAEAQSLQTQVTALKRRESAMEQALPRLDDLETQLVPLQGRNPYAEILLLTVAAQRSSGVDFPTYALASTGVIGGYPRYSVVGSVQGREDQVFEFIRLLEKGPFRVRVTGISYSSTAGAGPITAVGGSLVIPPDGEARIGLTLTYTGINTKP